jgi:L-rhamnose isomerase
MRRMTEIRLNIYNSMNMNDSGICYLIKNNPKLKAIELIDKHVNETTINAIIEKALNNPKNHFKFKVKYLKKKLIIEKLTPKNLLLHLCEYLWVSFIIT